MIVTNDKGHMTLQNHEYFGVAFSREEIEKTLDFLRKLDKEHPFDTLVGRGMSGASIVPILAWELGKNFALARKRDVSSHGTAPVVGTLSGRWIFVDDFIGTGRTLRATVDAVKDATKYVPDLNDADSEHKLEFVGAFLYTPGSGKFARPEFKTPEDLERKLKTW